MIYENPWSEFFGQWICNHQLHTNMFHRYYAFLYPFTKSKVFNTNILTSSCTLRIVGEFYYIYIIIIYLDRSANRVNSLSLVI